MPRKDCPSDLTDEQWQVVKNLVGRRSRRGRPPMDRREMINAIWYVDRNRCEWRAFPHAFPNGRQSTLCFDAGEIAERGSEFMTDFANTAARR